MFLEILKAKYLNDFKVEVCFNDGAVEIVDFENYLTNQNKKISQPLKNREFFSKVFAHPECGTLNWEKR